MTPSDFVELVPGADGSARLGFDEARAGAFAKGVADDFNPLHDPGDRRFCVPGDLLFAVLLEHYGLHRETSVGFASMVDADASLTLPPMPEGGGAVHALDGRGREVLAFFAAGGRGAGGAARHAGNEAGPDAFVRALILEYVRFSGRTFPEILVPLMREHGVMVNPDRPLVIYKDMAIRIDPDAALDGVREPYLEQGEHALSANGRKGVASLRFAIHDREEGRRLGEGEKNFVLGGLREHDGATVEAMVAAYAARREAWAA